jgi:hypothetical protein
MYRQVPLSSRSTPYPSLVSKSPPTFRSVIRAGNVEPSGCFSSCTTSVAGSASLASAARPAETALVMAGSTVWSGWLVAEAAPGTARLAAARPAASRVVTRARLVKATDMRISLSSGVSSITSTTPRVASHAAAPH